MALLTKASLGPLILFSALVLCLYWLGWVIYARFFHPLASIPGPWLASVSRTWYIIQVYRGNMEKTQR